MTPREHEGMQMMSSSAAMLVMQSQTVSQDESQHEAECGSVSQFLGSCPPSSEVTWKHSTLDPLELIVGKLTPVGTDVHSVVAQKHEIPTAKVSNFQTANNPRCNKCCVATVPVSSFTLSLRRTHPLRIARFTLD
uniref:(northern house mosquito) hypothetical protein n=1 Tax=Culex pipiens TaxID=7175 RepID=A0A8D8DB49_CULPI